MLLVLLAWIIWFIVDLLTYDPARKVNQAREGDVKSSESMSVRVTDELKDAPEWISLKGLSRDGIVTNGVDDGT